MAKNKITYSKFTETLGVIIKYNKNNACTNQKKYKKILKVLPKAIEGELTDRQKECLVLKYYDNLSLNQIALALDIDRSTVSRHIKKARSRLYKILTYYLNT